MWRRMKNYRKSQNDQEYSNKEREEEKRWMERKVRGWAMEIIGKERILRKDEIEKQRRKFRAQQYETYTGHCYTEKIK